MTSLADLWHYIGGDISTDNNGGVLTVGDTVRGQQRVLRRLLTNPGDYIFHPEYGAGLAQWIGRTADIAKIKTLILGQMRLEPGVSQNPPPLVQVTQIGSGDGGGFSVVIQYVDAPTGQPATLSFNVSA
jgi:hypothetical protein